MTNLITLAGEGKRFYNNGIEIPKPLVEVNKIPMIFRAVDCLPPANKYVFVCRTDHIVNYSLDTKLKERYPGVEIVCVDETTDGQACTAELGIIKSSIKFDEDILISSCDYGLEYDEFTTNADIIVWTTTNNTAFAKDPSSYSWVEIEKRKRTRRKKTRDILKKVHVKTNFFNDPFNSHAIVGTFYFKKAKYFLEGLNRIYEKNIRSNGEYYIDNIFNSFQREINIFTVKDYHCWGTPKDLRNYENKILG
jgi:NDP-sugar pyrophosphorylase family protein